MNTKKHLHLLLALLLVFCLALSACGGGSDNGGGETSNALTEEEYQDAVTKLGEDFTASQVEASNLDTSDVDAAVKLLEDAKAPLQEFIAITPPDTYAAAHEKLQSGSQAMVDYIDLVVEIVDETDPTKLQEASEKMMDLIQTAMTDLMVGSQLLEEAAN